MSSYRFGGTVRARELLGARGAIIRSVTSNVLHDLGGTALADSDGFGGTVPGAEPGQMGARDCATEPVRIVPINPSSQTSTLPFPQVRRYC